MISLNLISEKYRKELKYKNLYTKIKDFLYAFILFALLAGFILIIAENILQSNFNDLATLNSQLKKDKVSIAREIMSLNSKIAVADRIQQQFIPWSTVIADFTKSVPIGIEIHTLKINSQNWIVQGESENRETLLQFQSDLQKLNYFSEIKSPIANLLQKTNIDFELQMMTKNTTK
jgi:hypothetical protein